jgi:hypothetical protein
MSLVEAFGVQLPTRFALFQKPPFELVPVVMPSTSVLRKACRHTLEVVDMK